MEKIELKELIYSELDADLYEADSADYVAEKITEIAIAYSTEHNKALEKVNDILVKHLGTAVNQFADLESKNKALLEEIQGCVGLFKL